jgi:hypothetical protein
MHHPPGPPSSGCVARDPWVQSSPSASKPQDRQGPSQVFKAWYRDVVTPGHPHQSSRWLCNLAGVAHATLGRRNSGRDAGNAPGSDSVKGKVEKRVASKLERAAAAPAPAPSSGKEPAPRVCACVLLCALVCCVCVKVLAAPSEPECFLRSGALLLHVPCSVSHVAAAPCPLSRALLHSVPHFRQHPLSHDAY